MSGYLEIQTNGCWEMRINTEIKLAIMRVQYVLMNINTKVILACCAATSWPSSWPSSWVTKHIILERNF